MHPPRDPAVGLLPRSLPRATSLQRDVAIIHPTGDARWAELATKVGLTLALRGAEPPECLSDLALMPERSTPLPAAYRARPLILLGCLNTNRALQPLYADYLCSTDATYPGIGGHDLRTIVNPYGTGTNVILVGGSDLAGVERAVDRLLVHLATADESLTLPFLLDVSLNPELAARLAAWPFTPLDDTPAQQLLRNRSLMFYTEPIRVIGAYTLMWSWTGNPRYAEIARDTLLALNPRMSTGYGDWHYLAERFMRAIPLLIAGGWLSDEDIARTDELLMITAVGNQDEWWRMRAGTPPLGHRHQGKGTYEFLLLARYLRDQCRPTPALRELCDRWINECCAFMDGLSRACLDDQDDESTLNNLATLYRYALGFERHDFFTSGRARQVARRCLALHDGNGNGAGQGGYGESQGMYLQQEATVQTACCAFYYGDGELKGILHTLPNLALSQRYYFLHYAPVWLQKFDTGPELVARAPAADRAIAWLPVTDHQFAISNEPPLNVEFSGHLVNALETWQLAEAIDLNQLPQARGFDKLALRSGYSPADTYLLIQGYQGGFRWQGHMQAANAIVRFFQAGHVWLVQNTSRHSFHDKNGLLISDGRNDTPLPPFAEKVASADFPRHALTVTRLNDYHHTTWTRHLFWSRTGHGFFVVIDRVAFAADGPHSLTCTWRTPAHAELQGRRWQSNQGRHRFTLVCADRVPSTCEVDSDQGACEPYVLRQRLAGTHRAGEEASLQNLFHVSPQETNEAFDLQRLDDRSAVVQRDGHNIAWCAAAVRPEVLLPAGLQITAASVWIEENALVLAGATRVQNDDFIWENTDPLGLCLDLHEGTLSTEGEVPARPLPVTLVAALNAALPGWLAGWRPALTPPTATPVPTQDDNPAWSSRWTFAHMTPVPEPVRQACVTTEPLPIDGSPTQLLDPVMPDGYSREIWRQWPAADAYTLEVRFPAPQAVSSLRLLGDCRDDPTLRTFNPLPEGITVEATAIDGAPKSCPVEPAPDHPYKRYRDAENRLEVRSAQINANVNALRVRLPAPPDGRPFVLHRLEILSDRQLLPPITHWITADLDGDGADEIVLTTGARDLIVLGTDGRERWRESLPNLSTHVSAQPLQLNQPPTLCVGLLGGDLLLYHADGSRRATLPLAAAYAGVKDCLLGWYSAAHSLAIWHRHADGRGCLVVGGYAILLFLDADGQFVGHSFSDGPWNYNILVAPPDRPHAGDLFVRCGWNHGIMCYQGLPGDGPSGRTHSFGGFHQPMFRMLKRVVPFVNGRSLAAAWVDLPEEPEGAMLFAAELGCGLFSVARGDWRWKWEGGMSLNAATVATLDGRPACLAGGADGFVTAVDLVTGKVIRSLHAGDPVIGLNPSPAGELLVATRAGLLHLDRDWQAQGRLTRPLRRALPVGDQGFLLSHEDHTLERIECVTP